MAMFDGVPVQEKIVRDAGSKLNVIIVGAGLGGMGAAIAIALAGHDVTVLEAAKEIGEVGAGIQVLPNSARVLYSWGLMDRLEKYATKPSRCNFIGWKGNALSSMDYYAYANATGAPFWDFHRADLHRCLLERATELGVKIVTRARVTDFSVASDGTSTTVTLADGQSSMTADLVVGADGINSVLRESFLGHTDPPVLSGDLAYRLLLNTEGMRDDPDLRPFVDEPQVNYWVGPDAHAVNYVLKGGKYINMVLLVPDDIPPGVNILPGNVDEMRALYADWDPRIGKLLGHCDSVLKWRLSIRPGLEPSWSHPSGTFTMLGDAVHATLPYLASGAGMALEDAGVLGLCLRRLTSIDTAARKQALAVYEDCRRERTARVVERGTYNQNLYHLHDGPQQQERDRLYKHYEEQDRQWFASSSPGPSLESLQESGQDPLPWRRNGVGRWLLTYDMWADVEAHWPKPAKI